MKHFNMANRKDKPPPGPSKKSVVSDDAFDVWLNRGLHQLYDKIAEEPVPDHILKLIEDDRDK